jgi:hypothetical protein
MSRLITAGSITYEQLDFYYPPNSAMRPIGIVLANLTCVAFINNGILSWPMIDGTSVPDSSVSPGFLYFNSIADGFYGLRFFPHMIGFWRIVVKHASYNIEITKDYDIIPNGSFKPVGSSGLNASFVR